MKSPPGCAEDKMRLRKYRTSDCGHLAELFYHTVHSVNAKDYTKEQLDVWATGIVDVCWNVRVPDTRTFRY